MPKTVSFPGLDILKNYWVILATVVGFIMAWSGLLSDMKAFRVNADSDRAQVNQVTVNQTEIIKQLTALNQAVSGFNGKGGMQEDVTNMQKDIEKIKLDLAKGQK